jgi:hypothetical protein
MCLLSSAVAFLMQTFNGGLPLNAALTRSKYAEHLGPDSPSSPVCMRDLHSHARRR